MFWMFWRDELTTTAFTTASLRWLARLAYPSPADACCSKGGGARRGSSGARCCASSTERRHCGNAQPATVVVGNMWSLDITAVRPRDCIEKSGMGGGREQLVHHYVLVAATAAVRCLHSSKMELVQAHSAPPSYIARKLRWHRRLRRRHEPKTMMVNSVN